MKKGFLKHSPVSQPLWLFCRELIAREAREPCGGAGSSPGRVVSGDCSPETPTRPDVRNYASGSSVHRFTTSWWKRGAAAEADNAVAADSLPPMTSEPVASGGSTTCATRHKLDDESCGALAGCR